MATAAPVKDDSKPWERTSSRDLLPPSMSELRVVLLGNSWSQRSSVGNFILGENVFETEKAADCCVRVSGWCKWKETVVINTPDLLHPNISEHKLTEHVENCVRLSDPGPHVFLLVLQPEDFTEEQKLRLQSVLEKISDRSFDHSLVLISAPREESPGSSEKYEQHPPLKHMIRMCRFRFLRQKNLELLQLFTRFGQIVKENNGEHVICGLSDGGGLPVNMDPARAVARGLRIVLFGKSEEELTKLGNFIMKKPSFHFERFSPITQCEAASGEWRGKPVTVVKAPDMFSLSVEAVREEVKRCVSLCSPGPNVLLLLVKPSDFTEKNRKTLKFILSLFGQDALKHSMVVSTCCHGLNETSVSVNKLLQECDGRLHKNMFKNDHDQLMQKIENTVHENKGTFLTFTEESEQMKPALNLVLCGRRGAGKTSAAEVILGQTELHSVSNSSECVKHQGEVCGRRVSLVELPALYGKPQEEVMKESLRCISLCDPEGVHAFILVLPVGPLTDEDKEELETIQNTFSSEVNDFTMILFTVESDPTAPAVVEFVEKSRDIQELLQSCGGRSVVLNMKDKQQIPELLDTVEKMRVEGSRCFTKDMFTKAQIEKAVEQQNANIKLKAELEDVRSQLGGDDESQSREPLRMVLIGKTGSGRGSTANTILGKKLFKPRITPKLTIKSCEKATGQIDGRPVVLVNTPGLFDTSLSDDHIKQELQKCISLLVPGPHVFLLVLQIRNITPQEKDSVELIKRVFGPKSGDFTIIIFTRGEEQYDQLFESYIKGCDGFVRQLINDCGGRYQVFNNKDETNRTQVRELLTKIETMVKENGDSCYTAEMFDDTEESTKIQVERIMKEKEEEMKETKRKHEEELQTLKRKINVQRGEIEQERKLRSKQLKDKDESINKEREERKKEREEDKKRWKKQEETLRQEWRGRLEASDKRVQLEREQKETAERKLEQSRKEMKRDREAWDKEKRDMWERMHQDLKQNLEEEKTSFKKLQEEYYHKRKKWTYSFFVLWTVFLTLVLCYVLLR